MYVSMYLCTCLCIYVRIYVSMYVSMYLGMYLCTYLFWYFVYISFSWKPGELTWNLLVYRRWNPLNTVYIFMKFGGSLEEMLEIGVIQEGEMEGEFRGVLGFPPNSPQMSDHPPPPQGRAYIELLPGGLFV